MEKDFYIKLLSFCNDIDKEFNYYDLINLEFVNNDWEKQIVNTYFANATKNRENLDTGRYSNHDTIFWCTHRNSTFQDPKNKYILNYDAKFKYIDYIELKEARAMSQNANINANRALLFAVATIIISIVLSVWQIYSSVEIKNEQINQIVGAINDEIKN